MKASAHFTNLTLDPGFSCLLGTTMTGMDGRDDPNDLITRGGLHGLKGLVELTVQNCVLTDSNVLDLAKNCPKLTSFKACFCRKCVSVQPVQQLSTVRDNDLHLGQMVMRVYKSG